MLTRQHHNTTRRQFVGDALAVIGGFSIIDALAMFTGGLVTANASSSTSTQRLLMVGDSLTVGSLPYQAGALIDSGWTDIAINAHGSRGIKTKVSDDPHTGLTAVDALRAAHGDADLWVVALGTNDAGQYPSSQYPDLIASMLNRIGADHLTMWVNTYLPSRARLQAAWNSALNDIAEQRPDEFVVYDWAAYAAGHSGWLGPDSIHYTSGGYKARSSAVAAASTKTSQQFSGSQRTTDDLPVVTAVTAPAGFQPIPPVRILDTRVSGSRLRAGEKRTIDVSTVVASQATVVAVNLTAVGAETPGFLTAGPLSNTPPSVSTVNFGAGDATAGHAMALLSPGGSLDVYSSTSTDLVADVFGWFAPDAPLGLVASAPSRLIDTRSTAATEAAGSTLTLEIASSGGVTPKAAMLNILAANATTNGFITVWPADQAMPNVSCLNYVSGAPAIANLVQVGLDDNGRASVFTSGQAAVVVDLIATYDDRADSLRYQAVEAVRLLDTRSGRGGWLGPTARDQAIDVPIPDTQVVAAGVLTVTAARRRGWLSHLSRNFHPQPVNATPGVQRCSRQAGVRWPTCHHANRWRRRTRRVRSDRMVRVIVTEREADSQDFARSTRQKSMYCLEIDLLDWM